MYVYDFCLMKWVLVCQRWSRKIFKRLFMQKHHQLDWKALETLKNELKKKKKKRTDSLPNSTGMYRTQMRTDLPFNDTRKITQEVEPTTQRTELRALVNHSQHLKCNHRTFNFCLARFQNCCGLPYASAFFSPPVFPLFEHQGYSSYSMPAPPLSTGFV